MSVRHTIGSISLSVGTKRFITILKRGKSKGSALTGRVGTLLVPARKAVLISKVSATERAGL